MFALGAERTQAPVTEGLTPQQGQLRQVPSSPPAANARAAGAAGGTGQNRTQSLLTWAAGARL